MYGQFTGTYYSPPATLRGSFERSMRGLYYKGIYCVKYYGQGGGNGTGEKMKNEAVGNKMKKKEKGKGKRRKGKGGE